jgi:hypothetical protein
LRRTEANTKRGRFRRWPEVLPDFCAAKTRRRLRFVPRSDGDVEKAAQWTISGAVMGLFEPDKYRTKDKEQRQVERFEVVIEGADKKALETRR